MLLGVIADDFTGASDIANTITKGLLPEGGLVTAQYLGVPDAAARTEVEAGVVALKTRSVAQQDAVAQSLDALVWLLAQGCRQIVFKYCSTFDSTPQGNIGPVAEALAMRLGARGVTVCPAFPAAGRTVYQGHLFVHDKLLSESGMENHPLNPMTIADLRRWLRLQCSQAVGQIGWSTVSEGDASIAAALEEAVMSAETLVVVDAISERDLISIGAAVAGALLVTGGSGIAMALPRNFVEAEQASGNAQARDPVVAGGDAILVGSCSGATLGQVHRHAEQHPVMKIDVEAVMESAQTAADLVSFIAGHRGEMPLAYSSSSPDDVRALQGRYGRDAIARKLDGLFSNAARQLVQEGVRRLVVGGGETSGAVVSALDLKVLRVGRELDPGVPLLFSEGSAPVSLALKSGNFGSVDFFEKALMSMSGECRCQ